MSKKTPPSPPNDPDLTFEQAMHRLEALVESLDDGSTLDEALAAYEEGVHLARYCLHRLDTAELRVQQLGLEDAE